MEACVMQGRLLRIEAGAAIHHNGRCFIISVPELDQGDSEADPVCSYVRLFENGIELGPAHSPHDQIAKDGGGLFSHWGRDLYFSSGDGSSPSSNGYNYTVATSPRLTCDQDGFARSSLPIEVLLNLQRGILGYSYKGIDCFKCPFDLALYQRLIWNLKPRTIIEIGTWKGGSALWFADLMETYGIDGHLHGLDILEPPPLKNPRITFHRGDVMQLKNIFPLRWLETLPRPFLVIDDCGHFAEMTTAVLDHFAPVMRSGEYIIVEDAIGYEMLVDEQYNGGPRAALKSFLARTDRFSVDHEYCDYFGPNVTWNVNGYLKCC
jgi:cephalosporin hydroxylase